MPYNPEFHHRRSIRLPGYNYSQPGAYFITICVHNWECILGKIVAGEIAISPIGQQVYDVWRELPVRYSNVRLDAFCAMPNHVHCIVVLTEDSRCGRGLPEIIRAFKSFSARRANLSRHTPGIPFWQRNYYEHIIRNQAEWSRIRDYILTNPKRWRDDELNPAGGR